MCSSCVALALLGQMVQLQQSGSACKLVRQGSISKANTAGSAPLPDFNQLMAAWRSRRGGTWSTTDGDGAGMAGLRSCANLASQMVLRLQIGRPGPTHCRFACGLTDVCLSHAAAVCKSHSLTPENERHFILVLVLQAHRLALYAEKAGKGHLAQEALFDRTYEQGGNISDAATLAQVSMASWQCQSLLQTS